MGCCRIGQRPQVSSAAEVWSTGLGHHWKVDEARLRWGILPRDVEHSGTQTVLRGRNCPTISATFAMSGKKACP